MFKIKVISFYITLIVVSGDFFELAATQDQKSVEQHDYANLRNSLLINGTSTKDPIKNSESVTATPFLSSIAYPTLRSTLYDNAVHKESISSSKNIDGQLESTTLVVNTIKTSVPNATHATNGALTMTSLQNTSQISTTTPIPVDTSISATGPTTTTANIKTSNMVDTAGITAHGLIGNTTNGPPSLTPQPVPQTGHWSVNGTNRTCIMAQMAVQIIVHYNTTDGKETVHTLTLPADAAVSSGTCDNSTYQTLVLSWESTREENDTLSLHFTNNATTKHYGLHFLEVSINSNDLPDSDANGTIKFVHMVDEFSTRQDYSYRCLRQQTINLMTLDSNTTVAQLKISNFQFQAFMNTKSPKFSLADDCPFDTPDYVPITVGCALAGLVVIVLVAYLVGRRHSQTRGYLSM